MQITFLSSQTETCANIDFYIQFSKNAFFRTSSIAGQHIMSLKEGSHFGSFSIPVQISSKKNVAEQRATGSAEGRQTAFSNEITLRLIRVHS